MSNDIWGPRARLALMVTGALGGLSYWALIDVAPDYLGEGRSLLAVALFSGWFFGVLMGSAGPLPISRSALAGLAVAVPTAMLFTWASFRFEDVPDFFGSFHPVIALTLVAILPVPFLIAALSEGHRWRDYPTLFDISWNSVVRILAALLFTGAFWGVVLLSHLLLSLVGLDIIEDVLDIDGVPAVLTGAVLGLGVAVANDLSEFVSPQLPLRLLRLLLPVVTVVSAVFLAALPFRGLSGLFGEFSAAATLMVMAVAGVSLISIALDRDDDEAATVRVLVFSAQVMSVLVAALAVLAVLAVWTRVGQYGWSPDRVAAMTGGAICLLYGFGYAVPVSLRRNWADRIRTVNVWMALAILGVVVLWQTPLLNPQRIAANDQVNRFATGRVTADELDLWSIGKEWGRPGQVAIVRLSALDHPEHTRLEERLAVLEQATGRYDFEQEAPPAERLASFQTIRDNMIVIPAGPFPEEILEGRDQWLIDSWARGCENLTPGGRPGCLLISGDFLTDEPGEEIFILTVSSPRYVNVQTFFGSEGGYQETSHTTIGDSRRSSLSPSHLDRLAEGTFRIEPAPIQVLSIDGVGLVAMP